MRVPVVALAMAVATLVACADETEALRAAMDSDRVLPDELLGAFHDPWMGGDLSNLDLAIDGTARHLHEGCDNRNLARGAARVEFGTLIIDWDRRREWRLPIASDGGLAGWNRGAICMKCTNDSLFPKSVEPCEVDWDSYEQLLGGG